MTDRVLIRHGDQWLALTLEQYQAALNRGDELMPQGQHNAPHTAPDLLTAKQMAEKTSVPKSWWLEAAKSGLVPSVRLGKYVRFPASILTATDQESAGNVPSKQATARLAAIKG